MQMARKTNGGFERCMANSGCIGNLRKCRSLPDSNLKGSIRKKSRNSSVGKGRRWQLGSEAMENNASISVSLEENISSVPNSIVNDSKILLEDGTDTSFINHDQKRWLKYEVDVSAVFFRPLDAAEHWAAMRRQWVGHHAEVPNKAPREPVISWCTTYDDLLLTSEHFPQPIPLSEMVDFLVDIWHEEGLYD